MKDEVGRALGRVRRRGLLRLAALALAAGLVPSLYYVWGQMHIVTVGYRVEAERQQLERLRAEAKVLRLERARLSAPERIDAEGRRLGLQPVPPEALVVVQPLAASP